MPVHYQLYLSFAAFRAGCLEMKFSHPISFYGISLSLTVVLFISEIKGFVDPNEVITGEEDENCLLQVSHSCW